MLKKSIVFYGVFLCLFCNATYIFADIKSEKDNVHFYKKILMDKSIESIVDKEKILNDYGIISEKQSYGRRITRAECIQSILKIIGITEDIAEYYYRCVSFSKPAFDDSYLVNDNDETGFIRQYIELGGIYGFAEGEKISAGTEKFYPQKDVTLEECLQFMNNCLNKNPSDDIIYQAEKNGLIKSTDEILKRKDKTLSYDDFSTLLYRMLVHKIGYYFKLDFDKYKRLFFSGEENYDDISEDFLNNIKGMRYIDYLDSLVIDERVFIGINYQKEQEKKYFEELKKRGYRFKE